MAAWLHFPVCFSWQTSGYRCQASLGQTHVCFSCQLLDWFLSRFLQGSQMVISAYFLDCFCGRIPGLVDYCFRNYSHWEGFSFCPLVLVQIAHSDLVSFLSVIGSSFDFDDFMWPMYLAYFPSSYMLSKKGPWRPFVKCLDSADFRKLNLTIILLDDQY